MLTRGRGAHTLRPKADDQQAAGMTSPSAGLAGTRRAGGDAHATGRTSQMSVTYPSPGG